MEIIYKDEGTFVDYEVSGNKITFDDELMLNLVRYQRDDATVIDICRDSKTGTLVCGVPEAGKYVAQVGIPAREYVTTTKEIDTQSEEVGHDDETMEETREAVPFDIKVCTLSLWSV